MSNWAWGYDHFRVSSKTYSTWKWSLEIELVAEQSQKRRHCVGQGIGSPQPMGKSAEGFRLQSDEMLSFLVDGSQQSAKHVF